MARVCLGLPNELAGEGIGLEEILSLTGFSSGRIRKDVENGRMFFFLEKLLGEEREEGVFNGEEILVRAISELSDNLGQRIEKLDQCRDPWRFYRILFDLPEGMVEPALASGFSGHREAGREGTHVKIQRTPAAAVIRIKARTLEGLRELCLEVFSGLRDL